MKLFALSAVALLAACSNASTDTAEVAGDWVEADYTKPGAPLSLAYRTVKRQDVGDAPEVTLRLSDLAPNAVVEVELASGPGLDVLGTDKRLIQTDARGTATFTVDIRALTEGRHYLNVFAGTGEMGKRIVTVPVPVGHGQPSLKTSGELGTTADGRPVIVMEAEETIDGVPQ